MMLTLSPFAVDSLTPSYRHNQHPSRAPMPYLFSQLQAKGSYICPGPSRFPPVSRSCTFYTAVPSSSTPLHMPASSPSSDRPPSSRVRRTTSSVIRCYDRLIGSDSSFVALDVCYRAYFE